MPHLEILLTTLLLFIGASELMRASESLSRFTQTLSRWQAEDEATLTQFFLTHQFCPPGGPLFECRRERDVQIFFDEERR